MANIKSAIKRVEVTKKKTLQNQSAYSEMQTAIKKFKALVASNKADEAEKALPSVIALIDSNASAGVIHKNSASRRVATLSKLLNDLKTGKLVIAVKIDNKQRAAAKAAAAQAEKDKIKAENAAKAQAKAEAAKKPAKEDRKAKKAAAETEEVRLEKETKKEKKAKKEKAEDKAE